MLAIYTRSTSKFSKEFWKWAIRKLTGKYSGPDAVRESLVRGLGELNKSFLLDPKNPTGNVLVLSGATALQEAVTAKRQGRVEKIIAGPNISVHPYDYDRLICNPLIDLILVPSKWVADYCSSEAPEIADKIRIWPAGVDVSPASTRRGKPIIYDKIGDPKLLKAVEGSIAVPTRIFTYGSFKQTDYLKALESAPFLVYLAKSESQGLALQEAWAHDVPTFVNQSEYWENGNHSWYASQINAPYLTKELGAVFKNNSDLKKLSLTAKNIHPKKYCDANLSDKVSAQKLLNLLV